MNGVDDLRALKQGWDGERAPCISEAALASASILIQFLQAHGLPSPWLVPTSRGGVQAEWHQSGWDVEIEYDADGSWTAFIGSPRTDGK